MISDIDEFKGKWTALKNLSPERPLVLRRVATIELSPNRNTLKVRLREFVRDGFIERNGRVRATFYRLKLR